MKGVKSVFYKFGFVGMNINKMRLGELIKIQTGKLDANASKKNGKYPFFTCSKEPLYIDDFNYDCECVLVAGNGDLNVKYYMGKFNAYQRTYIIENKFGNKLYMPYLYYFLRKYVEVLRNKSIGGVIKYIKLNNLTEIKICLPNDINQKLIVRKLKKIETTIECRKKQIQLLDNLVKSRFVEMFGLPEKNNHGFEVGTIADVVKDVHYGTAKKASEDGKYIYIRMNNITYKGDLDLTNTKRINVTEKELAGCVVQQGDVLFNRTNSKELVGKTCHFSGSEPMIIAGYIIRLRMNGRVLPEYLSVFMNLARSKNLLYSMSKGAVGQANINAQEVQSIEIVIPPVELQQQFLKLFKQVDKSKFVE